MGWPTTRSGQTPRLENLIFLFRLQSYNPNPLFLSGSIDIPIYSDSKINNGLWKYKRIRKQETIVEKLI